MGSEILEQKDEDKEDPIEHLRGKAQSGVSNILKAVLEEEEVKNLISKAVVRQSLESALFFACLLIGALDIWNAARTILNIPWQGDVAKGIILIIIGSLYLFRKLKSHT